MPGRCGGGEAGAGSRALAGQPALGAGAGPHLGLPALGADDVEQGAGGAVWRPGHRGIDSVDGGRHEGGEGLQGGAGEAAGSHDPGDACPPVQGAAGGAVPAADRHGGLAHTPDPVPQRGTGPDGPEHRGCSGPPGRPTAQAAQAAAPRCRRPAEAPGPVPSWGPRGCGARGQLHPRAPSAADGTRPRAGHHCQQATAGSGGGVEPAAARKAGVGGQPGPRPTGQHARSDGAVPGEGGGAGQPDAPAGRDLPGPPQDLVRAPGARHAAPVGGAGGKGAVDLGHQRPRPAQRRSMSAGQPGGLEDPTPAIPISLHLPACRGPVPAPTARPVGPGLIKFKQASQQRLGV